MVGMQATPARATVELDGEGILSVTHPRGAAIEAADISRIVDRHIELAQGRRLPVLVDARGAQRMTRAARDQAVAPRCVAVTTAMAIVTKSTVSTLLGNFFMRVSRPAYPTRLFTDLGAARAWLLEHAARVG